MLVMVQSYRKAHITLIQNYFCRLYLEAEKLAEITRTSYLVHCESLLFVSPAQIIAVAAIMNGFI